VTINISGAADTPIAVDDEPITDEDTSTTISVLSNDTDPNNDKLTVTKVNGNAANVGQAVTLNSGALLTLNNDGTVTYNPNKRFESLNDGQTATDTFSYTVNDGNGNLDSADVTITIDGVTDPIPD
ncbi:MAG: Ig-like domain-containing protein, partial [Waterburya sp.]